MSIAKSTLCALGVLCLAAPAEAALFGATGAGGAGELYTLNPATGALFQDIGPLNDASAQNYGMTGLAFNPLTGVLYGSTANSNPTTAAKLVTINPATGLVTPIGSFNAGNAGTPATMGDLAFDAAGNLYGVGTVGGPHLYSINVSTGQATVIGSSGLTSTEGGCLAISSTGVFYGGPNSASFGTYNSTTGTFTNIINPAEPVGGAFAAFDFDASGALYALDLGPPSASKITHLTTINPTNGAVTDLGASVTQLDAIAIQVPEPAAASLIALIPIALAGARRRRRAL